MSLYLELNFFLAFGYGIFRGWGFAFRNRVGDFSAAFWLRLSRAILVSSVGLAALTPLIPHEVLFEPLVRVSRDGGEPQITLRSRTVTREGGAVFPIPRPTSIVITNQLLKMAFLLFTLGLVLFGSRFVRDGIRLRRSLRNLPCIRRIGRFVVLVTATTNVPYSAWLFGTAYVVIPETMLTDRGSLRIALAHEIQHHRQRDTVWVHALALARVFFFWNPFIYAWSRASDRLQEFANDEYLIRIRRFSLVAYGRCLLEAANEALVSGGPGVGTTPMAAGFTGAILKRRIDMLFEYQMMQPTRSRMLLVILGTAGLLATTAFAERSLVRDRAPLTYAEAQVYAQRANVNPDFPIEMNDLVLEELNRELSSEPRRNSLRAALERLQASEAMIRKKIDAFELAEELLAVPIVEARYVNYYHDEETGAGLWGFIVPTAKTYGLHVTRPGYAATDDRLVEHRETLAAMRYFTHLYRDLFHDWRLALLGYNIGERELDRRIARYATRDAWKLERLDRISENYLAKVITAVIVMRNPKLLE